MFPFLSNTVEFLTIIQYIAELQEPLTIFRPASSIILMGILAQYDVKSLLKIMVGMLQCFRFSINL